MKEQTPTPRVMDRKQSEEQTYKAAQTAFEEWLNQPQPEPNVSASIIPPASAPCDSLEAEWQKVRCCHRGLCRKDVELHALCVIADSLERLAAANE